MISGVTIVTSFAVVAVIILYFRIRWNSMRKIDQESLRLKMMTHLGIMKFFQVTGLSKFFRVREIFDFTASNGHKVAIGNPVMGETFNEVLKFNVREDDVFIATYPKAGTTWMQQIVWLITNNADTEFEKDKPLVCRIPFLETLDVKEDMFAGIQTLERWPKNRQRLIKTHAPYELMPEDIEKGKKCKIIYVARNAKDVCVSFYFFHKMNSFALPDPGTWNEFLTKYCSGNIAFGSWFPHVLKFWEKSKTDKERIYYTTYEKMKQDLRGEVVSISKFLGKELTDEQIDVITKHCTFGSMSKNKSANYSHAQSIGLDFKVHAKG